MLLASTQQKFTQNQGSTIRQTCQSSAIYDKVDAIK